MLLGSALLHSTLTCAAQAPDQPVPLERYELRAHRAKLGAYGFVGSLGVGMVGLAVLGTGMALDEPWVALPGAGLALVATVPMFGGPPLLGVGSLRAAYALREAGLDVSTGYGWAAVGASGVFLASMGVSYARSLSLSLEEASSDPLAKASMNVAGWALLASVVLGARQLDHGPPRPLSRAPRSRRTHRGAHHPHPGPGAGWDGPLGPLLSSIPRVTMGLPSTTTAAGTRVLEILSGWCRCHLVLRPDLAVLVDTGTAGAWPRLRARLAEHLPEGLPLSLVLTHTHYDHVGGAARVQAELGARVVVHASEAAWLASGHSPLSPGTLPPTRLVAWLGSTLDPAMVHHEPVQAHVLVEERLELAPGLELLHTPGHSRGSMSLLVDSELALVGDALAGLLPGSAWPPFADDTEEVVRSWRKLLDSGCQVFKPAHGSDRSAAHLG